MINFIENQKTNGVWIAIIPISFVACFASFQEMKPLSEDWKNILPFLTITLIMTALCIFMFSLKLKTNYTDKYVQVQYSPFHWKPKIFYWEDVAELETRTADCLKEYWGWGYKGTKKNRSYTAYGDFGLQLTFKNGNRLFIGSQKKEEMEELIDRIKNIN